MLAGMNSANVEKIELITTPPANYNAEGSAGIINIVLIENNSVGTNGAYTLAAGIGKNKLASANINFNHRKGKINLYGDGSVAFNDMDQPVNGYRRIDFAGVRKEAYTTNQRDASTLNFSGRLGIDVQLSKKTVAGALVSGYRNKWTMTSTSDASFLSNQQADTLIRGSIDEINLWKNIAVNLNVQHTFKKDHKLTVNADYLWYHDDNPNNYFNKWFNGMNDFLYDQEIVTQKKTPISFWVGSADYSGKLGKHIDWQAGGKFTLSGFDNDILIVRSLQHTWVTDSSLSANYTLKENISAAYISFTAGLGRKTTIKWGVRYEYTNSNLGTTTLKNIVDRHYGKLFPSFFISRKINDNSNVNFSYSRRITRPGFNDMAPFTIFFDPNSITTGNPALQPSISDAVSAGYTYSSYLFSLSYSYEAGAITRFQANIDPATNKQVSTPENLDNLKTLAFIMSVPFNPTKWWSMQNNFTGRWQQANTIYKTTTAITVAKYSFRFTSTQSFKLPKDFSIDLSGFYQSTDLSGRTQRLPQMIVDAGVQKKMANNKGKLSFTVADVFSSLRARLYTDLPSQNLLSTRTFKFSQRMFRLTWTRSFGNSKMENKRSRLDNLEEEKRRVE
jgi:outer membrane receptor protein involved in Fe transport